MVRNWSWVAAAAVLAAQLLGLGRVSAFRQPGWIRAPATSLAAAEASDHWWSTALQPNLADLSSTRVAITGGGAYSLALANVLGNKGTQISLLVRNEPVAEHINSKRVHPMYLSEFSVPDSLSATSDPAEALRDAQYIIHAVPTQHSRTFLTGVKHLIPSTTPLLSVSKGVEQGTFCLMNDMIHEILGEQQRAAFLSGPSFAQEMVQNLATAVVIASEDPALAKEFADLLTTKQFRCHTSVDVTGVELGGALKNVVALAAGMCEGLGLGMNAMSSLVTRGCKEMTSVGKLFGAKAETFHGLAGVGDTFGTCLSPFSRNRRVGCRLAKGEPLDQILSSLGGVSEGVFTALALDKLVRTKVKTRFVKLKFPIISAVTAVLEGKVTPQHALELMMQYPIKDEGGG